MKYIMCLLIATSLLAGGLPSADPTKPTYQKKDGYGMIITWPLLGGVVEVGPAPAVTMEEFQDRLDRDDLVFKQATHQSEYKKGSTFKIIGWAIIALGALLHLVVSSPKIQSMATHTMLGGGILVGAGIGLQKTVEYDTLIAICLFLGLAIVLGRKKAFSFIAYCKNKWSNRK